MPAQPILVSAGDDKLIKVWRLEHVLETVPTEGSSAVRTPPAAETHASQARMPLPPLPGARGTGLEDGEDEEVAAAALVGLRRGRWRCAAALRGHGGRILCLGLCLRCLYVCVTLIGLQAALCTSIGSPCRLSAGLKDLNFCTFARRAAAAELSVFGQSRFSC